MNKDNKVAGFREEGVFFDFEAKSFVDPAADFITVDGGFLDFFRNNNSEA